MPIDNGNYSTLSEDDIYERLVTAFEQQFDATVETGDLVAKQLRAEASVLAQNQEDALQAVYQSAYIQDATGTELEKLVNRIGLNRREAISATGVIEFISDLPPTATYTIPRQTTVQTDGSDPIEFNTTEAKQLKRIDGFEDGDKNGWSGDTGEYTVVTTNALSGSYSLEIAATDNTELYYNIESYDIGKTFTFDINIQTGGVKSFRFARQDTNNYYEVTIDEPNNSITIDIVDSGTVVDSATTNVTLPTGEVTHAVVDWGIDGELALRLYDTETQDTEIGTVTLTDSEQRYERGQIGFASNEATTTTLVDDITIKSTVANISAVVGGVDSNLTSDVVTSSSSTLAGVSSITNPLPTGNESYTDTDGNNFVQGRERETDAQLRERAFDSTEIGGAATVDAIAAQIRSIQHVDSLTIFANKTNTDNANGNGLPAHSFEPVVYYSGNDEDIAQAIFDSKAADSQDVGGYNGTAKSSTVESSVLAETETINWSKVPEVALDIDLTLIVDGTYVGDERIRQRIVNYIGGTLPNGSEVAGLDVGEDLYVAVLEDVITGPSDTGVWEVDSITIDGDGDGTDDTTTLSNGAEAYDTASSEVLQANGRDGSITITTVDK